MNMKGVVVLVLCLAARDVFSDGYFLRDIFDVDCIVTGNGNVSLEVRDVALFYLHPAVIPSMRVSVVTADSEVRTFFQPGIVWIFRDGWYAEFVYGFSVNGSGGFTQEGFAECNWETSATLATARVKGGFDHSSGILFLIPDVSFQYSFNPVYALKGQYFFGFNTDAFQSHSLQFENKFSIDDTAAISLLTTGIVENDAGAVDLLWSAGVRLQFVFSADLRLKYLIQYHALTGQGWGLENGLTVDFRL